MTKPTRIIVWKLVFLACVGLVAAAVQTPLTTAFMANPVFNGLILAVLAVGILINFRQVVGLGRSVAWIDEFRRRYPDQSLSKAPRLVAPMAQMLGQRQRDKLSLSAMSLRSLLDSIRSRLDEGRDIAHYMTGLLIFLGLLGTFWGLLTTVEAVGRVIGGLSVGGGDGATVFDAFRSGLQQPLSGMGTAFSSSLFGLAGSLVLGFLDLQAGHAQNRFFNELEEWLAGLTRLSSGTLTGDVEGSASTFVQALLEQTADSLDKLQRGLSDGERERRLASDRLLTLTEQLVELTDQMRGEMRLVQTLAENQADLRPVLRRLAEESISGFDEASRLHLRNMDVCLNRLHEQAESGREHLVRELRDELRLLGRTIAVTGAATGAATRANAPGEPLGGPGDGENDHRDPPWSP